MTFPIPTCRDAVILQHSYEIFSRHVELSIHDNMLLVHHLDSSQVLLLDVRARSNGPIAAPLPLTVATDDKVRYITATNFHQHHYSRSGRAAEPA